MWKLIGLKSFISTIWQLPQVLLGKFVARDAILVHSISDVQIYFSTKIEGISLGKVILVSPNAPEGTWLVKHEFGHVFQSRILGWLYLPVVVLPSYLWYKYVEKHPNLIDFYYNFWTESWANYLVNNRHSTRFSRLF